MRLRNGPGKDGPERFGKPLRRLFIAEKIKTEGFQLLSIRGEYGLMRSTLVSIYNMRAVANGDLSGVSEVGT